MQAHVVEFKRDLGPFDTWVMYVYGQWVGSWHDTVAKKLIVKSVFNTLIAMEGKEK